MPSSLARLNPRWLRLLEALLLFALCILLTRWAVILLTGAPLPVPPGVTLTGARDHSTSGMTGTARLFGSYPSGSLSENVQVVGMIADTVRSSGQGSVLISVDGRPAKAYQMGDDVEGRRLVAIRADAIEMEANGVRQVFRLPATPAAAAPGIRIVPESGR